MTEKIISKIEVKRSKDTFIRFIKMTVNAVTKYGWMDKNSTIVWEFDQTIRLSHALAAFNIRRIK